MSDLNALQAFYGGSQDIARPRRSPSLAPWAEAQGPAAYTSNTQAFESSQGLLEATLLPGLSDSSSNVDWTPVDNLLKSADTAIAIKDKNLARNAIINAWNLWKQGMADSASADKANKISKKALEVNEALGADAPLNPSEISTGPGTGEKIAAGIFGMLPGIASAAANIIPSVLNKPPAPMMINNPAPVRPQRQTSPLVIAGLTVLGIGAAVLLFKSLSKKGS